MPRALACLATAFLFLGAAPARQQQVVPVEYLGEWTNQPEYCAADGDDLDSVLTVTATHIGFFENHWLVKSVERTARGLRVSYFPRADFDIYAPNYLRLSPNRTRIFTSDDPKDTGYGRCSEGRD